MAMALVTQFDTPGSLRDAPLGSAFYTNWHNLIAGALITANGTGTGAGSKFYDASEIDVTPSAEHSLVWMGFPREVLMAHRDNKPAAFTQADSDVAFRNPQNEYCEWWVKRNAAGLITKVVIVTETPEYWQALWDFDRALVVALYRTLLGNPAISDSDLRVGGPGSAYNKRNPFNTTHGIVHFIQTINTLSAAAGLARGSVMLATQRDNYEMSGPGTSVDPRVLMDIGALARKSLAITLREPIGLYMAGYDDTGWSKPNGRPVDNYWRIVRGVPGHILRLEYEVPPGTGFVVGDIRIGGRRIEWGGQITEHITCMIGGIAGSAGR
jgi:hypothetical protein